MSIKKSILCVGLVAVCGLSSGCNAVRNYSVRSYQGPMPLTEYRYMDVAHHSIPAPQPVGTVTTTTSGTPDASAPAGQ